MFFKKFKSIILLFLLSYFIIPLNILAYSDYIIASGENIGIKLNATGVMIVGTYEIEGKNPANEAGLEVGDIITSINNNKITSINQMVNEITTARNNSVKIGYIRDEKEKTTDLNLYNDNGTYKTGLYVKDSISGIGTLTYIDPETKLFGALGHEITESTTGKIIEIWDKNGTGEGSYSGERNIKTKYKEGWYIPSSGDWGAFADYLKQKTYNPESGSYIENSGNYNSLYDLSPHYWTSSQISASNVWVVFFSNGVVGASGVLNTDFVRLGATF